MKIVLVTITLLTFAISKHGLAEIYKRVDKDGYVTYSDKPLEGATEPHEAAPITTIKRDTKLKRRTRSKSTGGGNDDEDGSSRAKAAKQPPNYTFSISTPENGAVIRANGGILTVQLSVSPSLNTGNNHRIVVKLDGQTQESQGTALTFNDVSRGPHTLSASIVDATGQVLTQSSPVSIQVLRPTIIKSNRAK